MAGFIPGWLWKKDERNGFLPKPLWKKLEKIPCTQVPYKSLSYRPASARMKDGTVEQCVVFFGATTFGRSWGPRTGRSFVPFTEVEDVFPSPYQLPPQFAHKIYRRGETRMGGIDFTITMKDSKKFYYSLGDLVDFIFYPEGYGQGDISEVKVGIVPEMHFHGKPLGAPSYKWCLYRESPATLKAIKTEQSF